MLTRQSFSLCLCFFLLFSFSTQAKDLLAALSDPSISEEELLSLIDQESNSLLHTTYTGKSLSTKLVELLSAEPEEVYATYGGPITTKEQLEKALQTYTNDNAALSFSNMDAFLSGALEKMTNYYFSANYEKNRGLKEEEVTLLPGLDFHQLSQTIIDTIKTHKVSQYYDFTQLMKNMGEINTLLETKYQQAKNNVEEYFGRNKIKYIEDDAGTWLVSACNAKFKFDQIRSFDTDKRKPPKQLAGLNDQQIVEYAGDLLSKRLVEILLVAKEIDIKESAFDKLAAAAEAVKPSSPPCPSGIDVKAAFFRATINYYVDLKKAFGSEEASKEFEVIVTNLFFYTSHLGNMDELHKLLSKKFQAENNAHERVVKKPETQRLVELFMRSQAFLNILRGNEHRVHDLISKDHELEFLMSYDQYLDLDPSFYQKSVMFPWLFRDQSNRLNEHNYKLFECFYAVWANTAITEEIVADEETISINRFLDKNYDKEVTLGATTCDMKQWYVLMKLALMRSYANESRKDISYTFKNLSDDYFSSAKEYLRHMEADDVLRKVGMLVVTNLYNVQHDNFNELTQLNNRVITLSELNFIDTNTNHSSEKMLNI